VVKDNRPVFREITTLLEADDSVEMRLKHVKSDIDGVGGKDSSPSAW